MIKSHTFNGVRHDIDTGFAYGYCDTPQPRRPTLYAPIGEYSDLKELRVLIHEALHACNWKASEQRVDNTSSDIARFLYRLGYRRQNESISDS